MKARYIVFVGLVMLAGGCASVPSSPEWASYNEEVKSYSFLKWTGITLQDVLLDVIDIVSIDAGYGEGFMAEVQPTKLIQAGLGYHQAWKAGWHNRAAGFYTEERSEGGFGPIYYRRYSRTPIWGSKALFEGKNQMADFTIRHNENRHWADVGGRFHLLISGFGVYVSPKEATDAAGGIVMLPYNLVARPIMRYFNKLPADVDFSDDDTLAKVRAKHGVTLVEQQKGLEPVEKANEALEVPY